MYSSSSNTVIAISNFLLYLNLYCLQTYILIYMHYNLFILKYIIILIKALYHIN